MYFQIGDILKFISVIDVLNTSGETVYRSMPLDFIDDETTLVQLMALYY